MVSEAVSGRTHGQRAGARAHSVVPAVDRSAVVLRTLAAHSSPLALRELAAEVDMPRSSLHNICSSLAEVGFVEKARDGRYSIGLGIVELARRKLASMEIVSTFQAACRMVGPTPETIVLSVLSGDDAIYLSFIAGTRPLAVRYEVGMRLPAPFTASGKAMLASLPESEVRERFGQGVVNAHTGARKSIEELLRDLQETRERGYSIDDEEVAPGMTCIGCAVYAGDEPTAAGAVAISLVKSITDWFDVSISEQVCRIAGEISRRLGAPEGRLPVR